MSKSITRLTSTEESCCRSQNTWGKRAWRGLSVLVLALLFVGGGQLYASHFVGGQITWENTGGNDYRVTLKLYRDCSGINFGSSQTISVSGGCGGSFSVSEISRVDITPLCPGQSSRCSGGSVPGVQEIIYTRVRTINPQIGNCTFAHSGCCRNSLVNSTVSAGSWYIASVFNSSTSPRNSSPQFLNPPLAVVCANQPATISPNAFDADGDALVYSLVSCKQSASANAAYQSGFNYLKPISTAGNANFTINSGSGLISFTPTAANQAGIVCIRVEEYRGGVKIGEVIRDIQIQVRSCNNNNPVVSVGANMVIQPGATACKTITVTDADGDNLTVTATSGIIPPGTFTILSSSPGSVTAEFCYTATAADQGKTFTVSINAQDNSCPTPGLGFGTFNVTVPVNCNNTSVSCSATDETGSNTNDGTASATATGFTAPINYNWTGPGNYVGSGQTVSGLAPGTYIVQVVGGLGCVGTCTTTVNPGCQPAITCPSNISVNNDAGVCGAAVSYSVSTTGCAGESVAQTAGLASGSTFPVGSTTNTYTLSVNGNAVGSCSFSVTVADAEAPSISCPSNISVGTDAGVCGAAVSWNSATATDNCPFVNVSQSGGQASGSTFAVGMSTVSYTATDASGNTASCSFTVRVSDTEAPSITCAADLTIDCVSGVPAASVSNASASDNCGATVSLSGSTNNGGTGCAGDDLVITRTYTATDAAGNSSSCTRTITVDPVDLAAASTAAVMGNGYNLSCNAANGAPDGEASASASGGCAPYSYSWSDGQTGAVASGLAAGTYTVTITDANGCTASSSVTLTEPPVLEIDIANDCEWVLVGWAPQACVTLTAGAPSGGTAPYTVMWSNGDMGLSTQVCPDQTTTYEVTVTDANGCTATDNITVTAIDARCGKPWQTHKVAVCHYPPGNVNNPQQICIALSAVGAHVSQAYGHSGCHVGPCGAVDPCTGDPFYSGGNNKIADNSSLSLEAYPNPTNGMTSLELSCFECDLNGAAVYTVVDMQGKVLASSAMSLATGSFRAELDMSSYNSGIYFVQVQTDKGTISKKVVKY